MTGAIRESARILLDEALSRGADEVEVAAYRGSRSKVAFEKNDLHVSSSGSEISFQIEVHKDGKKGTAGTNETDRAALGEVADRAITLSEFSLKDEYLLFPEPRDPPELPGRFDKTLAAYPAAELHRLAADFVSPIRAEERISLDGAELTVSTGHQHILNSRGVDVEDETTRMGWGVFGMGKTDAEVTSFDYRSGGSWFCDGAEAGMRDSVDGFIRGILSCFGPRKIPSYKGFVLLSPAVIGELVLFPILFHVSGRQIMDGKSRWADSLGESVASGLLTLQDDPFDLELGGARPFDDEGVPSAPLTIVDRGSLVAHTDDTYTANRRGTVSTGHAGGRKASSIAPGVSTLDELRAAAPRIITVERFSGNVDPISGDFSGVAKNSHLWVGGEFAHPITETMVAGNVFDLIQNVAGISDHAVPWDNHLRVPWILADGVSVTGE